MAESSDLSEWPRSTDEEGFSKPTKMSGTAIGQRHQITRNPQRGLRVVSEYAIGRRAKTGTLGANKNAWANRGKKMGKAGGILKEKREVWATLPFYYLSTILLTQTPFLMTMKPTTHLEVSKSWTQK